VFANKMWIVGGYRATLGATADVWSSQDAVAWKQEAPPPFPARYGHGGVVYNGRLWIMGGTDKDGNDLNDVWSTADGRNWTQMSPSQVPWSPRALFATAVLDRLYLIGPRSGDVWTMAPAGAL
jgi:hypothetical protein